MELAYIRVSTVDQKTDRQEITADRYFTDKATGTNTDRPQLQELLRTIRSGDIVKVWSIDRLARSITDMHNLINEIIGKGADIVFIKENLTFTADKSNPMNELMLNLLSSVYQFETAIRKERQLEGIEKAKAKGVYTGRSTAMRRKAEVKKLIAEGISYRNIATQLEISLSSVQRIVKTLNNEN